MKAILLAAGKGTRISRMVQDVPKSTLPIAGTPLIRQTVERLKRYGMDVVICVGYMQETIREALEGYDVKYYFNPFFDVTNSIASLWFARDEIDGECVIMNADVFFSDTILDMLIAEDKDAVVLVDRTRRATGDYFFATTDNGCISEYGKDLPLALRSCEYVGIGKISEKFIPVFKDRLDTMINHSEYDKWWENVLYSFAKDPVHHINTKDVEGHFWSEIDYFDDYERILNHLKEKEERKNKEVRED